MTRLTGVISPIVAASAAPMQARHTESALSFPAPPSGFRLREPQLAPRLSRAGAVARAAVPRRLSAGAPAAAAASETAAASPARVGRSPLVTAVSNVSAPAQAARAGRLAVRKLNWKYSPIEKLRDCGKVAVLKGGRVALMGSSAGGRWNGVATCASPALCPVCSRKLGIERAGEIAEMMEGARRLGYVAGLVTFTLQHRAGMPIQTVYAGRRAGWGAMNTGRAAIAARSLAGDAHIIRVDEETHGANGWHPHIHSVVFVKGGEDAEARLRAYADWAFSRWESGLAKHGLRSLRDSGGLDVRIGHAAAVERLADYLTKSGQIAEGDAAGLVAGADFKLALEASAGAMKEGKGKGRAPFQLLAAAESDPEARALWVEYSRATHGTRRISYTKGMREKFALPAEEKAAKIAEAVAVKESERVVLLLSSEAWRVVREESWVPLELLESGGVAAVCAYLDGLGVPYSFPVGGSYGGPPPVDFSAYPAALATPARKVS